MTVSVQCQQKKSLNRWINQQINYLDAQIPHELSLEVDDIQRKAVGGQLGSVEAAGELLLLKDCHVAVAESGEECCARNGGRAAAEEGHPLPVQVYNINICDLFWYKRFRH